MNELDANQKTFHNKHYSDILLENRYDGYINPNSIWYWMHTFCLNQISDFFKTIPPSYFLTVGDGYCGREAGYIKKFGHKVHSTDVETCLIKIAYDKNIIDEFSEQDVNHLSFDDETFDYSLSKECLHHTSKPYLGLYELFRVSKQGVIIIEPNGEMDKDYSTRGFELSGNYSFSFKSDELIKIGIAYGFKHFLITYSDFFFGRHNNENISSGKIEIEKERLIKMNNDTNPLNMPYIIFIFLKDEQIFNSLSNDNFKKIII